jgi:hypothetical protein
MTDQNQPLEPVHKYCESVKVASTKDVFVLGFQSGGELGAYVVTPDHAKQIWRLLGQHIGEYEKANGTLEGRLPTDPQPSPIQVNN